MWMKDVFNTNKPIVAMLHLAALPGDPLYDTEKGMKYVVERAKRELHALQEGGVDGVLVSNEYSFPYKGNVDTITVTSMARVIGELKADLKIPLGVNVISDPYKVFDLAVATEALFVRGTFTGAYAGDHGVVTYDTGDIMRHKIAVGAGHVKCMYTLVPEASKYLVERTWEEIADSTVFRCQPDALLVAGFLAGREADTQIMTRVKKVVPNTPVFANTGVRLENLDVQLAACDGAIVGTTFKEDGDFYKEVDYKRVKEFMDKVKSIRENL
jgi:membrane complex biogenesis BtpA family protein